MRFHPIPSPVATWAASVLLVFMADWVSASEVPIELGRVHWGRDVEAGFETAQRTGRPLLLLFQEIPGCATCKSFGRGPLSSSLLVDAMETEFVPVVVYNNRPGADAETLRRFGEAAWNNPVLRFFRGDGHELLPRRDGIWDVAGITERLQKALEAAQRPVPPYLSLAAQEIRRPEAETALLGMHCFWQGEAALGALDGVIETRPVHVLGGEAVEVTYVPAIVEGETLLTLARRRGAADRVYLRNVGRDDSDRFEGERVVLRTSTVHPASESDTKWYLKRSSLRWVPMTQAQAARVNADLAAGRDGSRWLGPRQLGLAKELAERLQGDPDSLPSLAPAPPLDTETAAEYEAQLRHLLHDAP